MTERQSTPVLYAPDASSSLAMHVAHTLSVRFKQHSRALCGNKEDFTPDMVPVVTSGSVDYRYGFVRELRAGEEHLGWGHVVRQYPWLRTAKSVVCVSPQLAGQSQPKQQEAIKNFYERPRSKGSSKPAEPRTRYGRPLWAME